MFAAICVTTTMWGVFAFIPFTYTQVIQFRLFDPLSFFADAHPLFAWIAAALLAFILRERIRRGDHVALAVLALVTIAAAGLTAHPVLTHLRNDSASLWIGLSALTPILLLAFSDWNAYSSTLTWRSGRAERQSGRLLVSAAAAAAFVWALYAGIGVSRGGAAVAATEAMWASAATLALFGGVVAALACWEAAGGGSSRREFFIGILAATFAISVLLYRLVLNAIAFAGTPALIAAAVMGFAFALTWASVSLTLRSTSDGRAEEVRSGVELWFAPSGLPTPWWTLLFRCALVAGGAWLATRQAGEMDWNFLTQKLIAIVVWTLTLATMFAAAPRFKLQPASLLVMAVCAAPIGFGGMERWGDRERANHLADLDPSFRVLRDALMPAARNGDPTLYDYLQANTNIPRDTRVDPIDVNLIDSLRQTGGARPNIFVIVVDSLRRDYLSTYNPAVSFTPSIAAFARDAVLYTNAYTRYGATGLSEPSIWAGGMLIHKQYVTPFAPMDTLEKLLEAERYREFVGVDTILSQLLEPTSRRTALDEGIANRDYDLCRSLDELAGKVAVGGPGGEPMFAYTQAQNLHISTISRQGSEPIDQDSYNGFDPPYASRVKRLDGCFGGFIARLKATGVYDRSIVVLTSDHGDSLGEEGRHGHAYTVFPEVIRIPLLVHLPPALAAHFDTDPAALAFSTDITPSLYTLLGHAPTHIAFPLGRSFVHELGHPLPARPRDELVASSYGAVYGVLRDNARRLYIVDAINYQDYAYDLTKGLIGRRVAVTNEERETGQAALRRQVETLADAYGFPNPPR